MKICILGATGKSGRRLVRAALGVIAICLLFASGIIWLAPKPKGPIDTSNAH